MTLLDKELPSDYKDTPWVTEEVMTFYTSWPQHRD
jgi:hypothetical protein